MPLAVFKFEDLHVLDDGAITDAMNAAFRKAVIDCDLRRAEDGNRVVSLDCVLAPVRDENGNLDGINLSFSIKEKVPAKKSKKYSMARPKAGEQADRGVLIYSVNSPTNVRQGHLADVAEERENDVGHS